MTDSPDRRDVQFLLHEWLDVRSLTARPRFAGHGRDVWDSFLDVSADIAARHFAPCNAYLDAHPPVLDRDGAARVPRETAQAVRALVDSGLVAACFDVQDGGLQLPTTIARAALAFYQGANAGVSNYALLTIAAANLLRAHGAPDQVATYLPALLDGTALGTMCLSEPQAGSSLADITTRAIPAADGTYRIVGTKTWISGGDQDITPDILHMVLARLPGGPPGVHGISLFLVPKLRPDGSRNDVTVVGLNHKLGNRATTNAVLAFGDGARAGGAVGYLIGERNRGLHLMFTMMNEARLGVGLLATAIGYAGHRASVDYARTRRQGRAAGADPGSPPVPIIEHADVRRMLLAQKSYVEGALGLQLYCARLSDVASSPLDDEEGMAARRVLDVLTPIAKTWPAEWCLAANDLAIQIHGGYGYTPDFLVEQLWRDNRLNQIHEGTTGVQGLDLLGRKVGQDDGTGFTALCGVLLDTAGRAAVRPELAGYAAALDAAVVRWTRVTAILRSAPDRAAALANATTYLRAAGHLVIAWVWLEQLLACGDRTDAFYAGKHAAGRYFFRHELPAVTGWLDGLAELDRTVLDADPGWF